MKRRSQKHDLLANSDDTLLGADHIATKILKKNQAPQSSQSTTAIIFCALLWFSSALAIFLLVYRVQTFFPYIAKLDFPVFKEYAEQYLANGKLYVRNLDDYYPGANVYKFPPLSGGVLAALLAEGFNETTLITTATFLHIITVFICCYCILRLSASRSCHIIPLTILGVFLFWGLLEENLRRLQLEFVILACITVVFFCLYRRYYWLAGVAIGVASALKIYPILLLITFIHPLKKNAIYGAVISLISLSFIGLFLISPRETLFFSSKVLPILISEPIVNNPENLSPIQLLLSAYNLLEIKEDTLFLLLLTYTCKAVLLTPLLYALYFHKKQPSKETWFLCFSVNICVMLLLISNSWINYQLLLIPAAVTCGVYSAHQSNFVWRVLAMLQLVWALSVSSEPIIQSYAFELPLSFWILQRLLLMFWPLALAVLCCQLIKISQNSQQTFQY